MHTAGSAFVCIIATLVSGAAMAQTAAPTWQPAPSRNAYPVAKKKSEAIAPKPADQGDPEGKPAFDVALAKAQSGDLDAMSDVASYYLRGWGVGANEAESRAWIKRRFDTFVKRAEDGDLDSLSTVADSYEYGNEGQEVDAQKAKAWTMRYREALRKSAESGNADSMGKWADALNFEGDYTTALTWWLKAASAGNYPAMRTMGDKYDDGTDVPADRAQAFAWYLKAEKDPADPWSARIVLAQKYKTGDGVAKNPAEAARLHVAIAENYGGWRKRMKAESFAEDVTRAEPDYRVAVQAELAARGLYTGARDGKPSEALNEAIKAVWRRKEKVE